MPIYIYLYTKTLCKKKSQVTHLKKIIHRKKNIYTLVAWLFRHQISLKG